MILVDLYFFLNSDGFGLDRCFCFSCHCTSIPPKQLICLRSWKKFASSWKRKAWEHEEHQGEQSSKVTKVERILAKWQTQLSASTSFLSSRSNSELTRDFSRFLTIHGFAHALWHFDQALLHGAWERAPKTYLCKRPASQPPQNFDLWIRCSASAQAFGYPKVWIGCEHTDEHTFERWYHLLESRHRVQTSQHPYCRSQHHPTSSMQLGNSKYQQLLWAKHQVMW